MEPVRSRHWKLVALVAGALLLVSGIAAPAEAATKRAISFSVSPTSGYAGGAVKVAGKLTRSPKGTVVRIQRKAGKKWVAARNTRTLNAAGAYSTTVTLPKVGGPYTFRAVALKTKKLRAATSRSVKTVAYRKVTATIRTSPSTIELDQATTISGTVSPFIGGTIATIQRFDGVRWTTYFTVPISRTGTFAKKIHPIANSTYRVVVPKKGYYAAAASPATKLVVSNGPIPPEITTTTLPSGRTETPYNQTLTKTGKTGSWAVTAGLLPPNLFLNSSTGAITGSPTAAGDFTFTVTYSETETLLSDSQQLAIHVNPIAKITTTSLPNATAYGNYSTTLAKSGLDGTWSVQGLLPNGIDFTPAGLLSGKPTVSGDFPLTFTFKDATDFEVTKALNLHVNVAPDPVITTTQLTAATAFRSYTGGVAKTGNDGTWSREGALPAGITFDTATGALSGKPTVSGDFPITFTFTETESGTHASKLLTLHVNEAPNPVVSTTSLPAATAYQAGYSATVAVAAGALPGTWSIDGTPPAGITFDAATATLSGKPTVAGAGDYLLTFTYTETESGKAGSKQLTLHVNAAPNPVISTTSLPNGVKDVAYVAGTKVEVSTPRPGTWSITGGALPTGITLNENTGALIGTPTVAGSFPVTFTFTETESGTFASKQLTLTVLDRPVITTSSLPDATRGDPYSQTLVKTGGSGNGTWAITAGSLPAGLTLNASTGKISGTPTTLTDAANEEFTVRFSDTTTGLLSTPKVLSIHVAMEGAPTFNTAPNLPDATVGVFYDRTISMSGAIGGTFSVQSGTVPPGISVNGAGRVFGTPTTPGTYKFVVKFTALLPLLVSNTRQFTIVVN